MATRRRLRRQDPQGGQARRPPRRAANQVRARHQPQDRQGSQADDPAIASAASGRGDAVSTRRAFIGTLAGGLLAPLAAQSQPTGKVYRIGWLSPASAANGLPNLDALRAGLRELGYVEGRNITIEVRWADGVGPRLSKLATELVALRVDVICTAGSPASLPAKQATT